MVSIISGKLFLSQLFTFTSQLHPHFQELILFFFKAGCKDRPM